MPPVMKPVGPAFEIVTMTIAPIEPSIGSIELSEELTPSPAVSSGGGCTVTRPLGTLGDASRALMRRHPHDDTHREDALAEAHACPVVQKSRHLWHERYSDSLVGDASLCRSSNRRR